MTRKNIERKNYSSNKTKQKPYTKTKIREENVNTCEYRRVAHCTEHCQCIRMLVTGFEQKSVSEMAIVEDTRNGGTRRWQTAAAPKFIRSSNI